jgi:hypothetical protein
MDELRNNDRSISSERADRESTRQAAGTETAPRGEGGTETIARIPISRSVIIDERQQPLPSSDATSTATMATPIPDTSTTATPTTTGSEAQTATAARDAARETGSQRTSSVSVPTADDRSAEQAMGALFPQGELQQFRVRWDQVQASFVDDPRRSVQEADNLVASVVKRIADQFAEQRGKLEGQWSRGDDATTEELRRSMRQYRAFFERLLSM